MQFVPWRHVAEWKCKACGECCRLYSVVLNFQEWLRIVRNYGAEYTVSGLNKLFIRRKDNGECPFLCGFSNVYACGLQHSKPKACKLWPFKVMTRPAYGFANKAAYSYGKDVFYVYADSMCSGIRYGAPTFGFEHETVKEFIEIALGIRQVQQKTTSKIGFGQLPTIRNIFSRPF
ncbi:MAG: YkgJ family cysteine cluster protein [Candidatus Bathyarchaeia archaeon]